MKIIALDLARTIGMTTYNTETKESKSNVYNFVHKDNKILSYKEQALRVEQFFIKIKESNFDVVLIEQANRPSGFGSISSSIMNLGIHWEALKHLDNINYINVSSWRKTLNVKYQLDVPKKGKSPWWKKKVVELYRQETSIDEKDHNICDSYFILQHYKQLKGL